MKHLLNLWLLILALSSGALLSACGAAAAPAPSVPAPGNLEEILSLRDPMTFSEQLYEYLQAKCSWGTAPGALSQAEETVWLCSWVCDEVNADGFAFFFYNYGDEVSDRIPAAYRAIGAEETAEIFEDALAVLDRICPAADGTRSGLVSLLKDPEAAEAFSRCDESFWAYPEDLNVLIQTFVLSRSEEFT